ncbi:MAG: hypothetical protein IKZ13_07640 [Akkermansia sp.]|nr:hypothetical protein [Akkermansia sp.]
MMELDCRNKITLADGCICVHTKGVFFDLLAPDGALLVQCLNESKFWRSPVFRDAQGREMAKIRFKGTCPVLRLPGCGGREPHNEIELKLFRNMGREFCPHAEIDLLGTKIISRYGYLSVDVRGLDDDKQNLLKAILCFCRNYQIEKKKEQQDFLYLLIFLIILNACAT